MAAENVELVVRIRAEGQALLDALKTAMGGLNDKVKSGTTILAQFDKTNEGVTVTLKQVSKATDEASASHKRHSDSITGSVLKANLLTQGIQQLISTLKQASVDSALYAARTEQLGVVNDQLARAQGLSIAAVRSQVEAVKTLGITTQDSRETINKMIFAQLDLRKATDLARMAQDAAKIAGISSSDALTGIITGIIEQRVQVLRTYGVQVSFEQALIRGAAALHKTRETLSDYERSNIALNEVLSKAPRIFGSYILSLGTAAGQLQSLQRYSDEAKNAIGENFLPIVSKVVTELTELSKWLKNNADEASNFASGITAAGVALAVAKFTPGGPAVKTGAAIIAGFAAFAATHVEPEIVAADLTKEQIRRIEEERVVLKKKFQLGIIKTQEEYLEQDAQLKKFEVLAEELLTEKLAKVFKDRQDRLAKLRPPGTFSKILNFLTSGDLNIGAEFRDLQQRSKPGRTNAIGENTGAFDLGAGRSVTAAQIQAAIEQSRKPQPVGTEEGLQLDPEILHQQQIESQRGEFQNKLKQATKTATAALERARAGLLSDESKITQERAAEFRALATEFSPFDKSLKDAKEFNALLATVAKTYDLILEKQKRTEQVEDINRAKKFKDATEQIQIDKLRQQAESTERLFKAEERATPGSDRQAIEDTFARRVSLANQEAAIANRRNQEDVAVANRVANINKDKKVLADALLNFAITDARIRAQLEKEIDKETLDRLLALIELKKKDREAEQHAFENRKKIIDTEREVKVQAIQGAAEREIRLIQARAEPGTEFFQLDRILRIRINAVRQEHDITTKKIESERADALFLLDRTKDKIGFEKTIADLRSQEIKNDAKLENDLANARIDKEVQIAELRRKQTEELRQSLGSLFDALQAKGGFGGFKDFLDGYFKQIEKTIFINIGEILLKGSQQKFGDIIPGQTQKNPRTGEIEYTIIGKILRGTPLGVDPVKIAQQNEIKSRDRNTQALDRVSNDLEKIVGQAGNLPASLGGPASGGFGGVFGSGVNPNNPFIFSGFPTGSNGPAAINPITGQIVSGSPYQTGLAGLFSRIGGGGGSLGVPFDPSKGTGAQFFDNIKNNPAAAAAVIALGAAGIRAGIQEGGARGTLTTISAATGTAAALDPEPISKGALAAVSVGTGLVRALFPDPRKQRAELIDRILKQQSFKLPSAIERITDFSGNELDFNFRGGTRVGAPVPSIIVNINALDARSFEERGPEFADVIQGMVQMGHPLRSTIGDVARS